MRRGCANLPEGHRCRESWHLRPITREDIYQRFPPEYGEERTPATMDAYQAFLDRQFKIYGGTPVAFERCPAWMKEIAGRSQPGEKF